MTQTDEEIYTMFLDGKNQYCENEYTIQSNLEREKWSWRIQAPGLQALLQATVIKAYGIGRLESPKINHASVVT